jgi:hypothetical protein
MISQKIPKNGYGYIYILSNRSLIGIHKVGLTTNSIEQRIKELNSTGVPTSFIAENIYEIKQAHLRNVEKEIHLYLKNKGYHHGKEFFKIELQECRNIAEDVIFRITKETSEDIVGLARQRKEIEDKKRESELKRRAFDSQEKERRQKALNDANEIIRRKRLEWILEKNKEDASNKKGGLGGYLLIAAVIPFLGFVIYAVGLVLTEALGFFVLFALIIAGFVWWHKVESEKTKNHQREKEEQASKLFPYKSIDEIPNRKYIGVERYGSEDITKNKKIILCRRCSQKLRVPVGVEINVKCPKCKEEWQSIY